jgi:two-component system cell cycle response regulator
MTHKSKILIVDDEPLNVKLFAAALNSDGYEIIRAFNGEQALKKVDEELPDLVLLDIMMPDIDGFEVTRRLKGNFETRDIPIILITASDAADYKAIGHEAGADEFLNKPIQAIELKSRVKSLIHTKKYQDKLALQSQAEIDKICFRKEDAFCSENEKSSVLLVDEDMNDAKIIKMYLHGQPYQVIVENTFKRAVDISNQRQVDLILLDVNPGKEEGFEACGRLKEREQTANTQILVMSSSEFLKDHQKQFELWSDDFLIKPINVHELRLRVKALLKKKTYLDTLYTGTEGSVRSAIADSLSGLANYSYFKFFLEHEIRRSIRDGTPVALLMMEIADFKYYPNDLGHPAGEKLLKELGTLIKENIRDIDLGARCKEKQFAVVLANTDGNGAHIVGERLKGLFQNRFSTDASNISAKRALRTGMAAYPSDAKTMDSLLDQAQKMLLDS